MKKSGLIFVAFLMFLWSPEVSAQDVGSVSLSFTPPTENTNGTPLTDLAGYNFYYGSVSGDYPNSVTVNDPTISSYVINGLTEGDWFFVATSFNDAGVESVFSNEAMKTVVITVVPNPPGMLTVSDITVYTTVKITDGYRLVAVGTVPPDTVCDASQSVNNHYVVPLDSVQWSASVRDVVVVAKCS